MREVIGLGMACCCFCFGCCCCFIFGGAAGCFFLEGCFEGGFGFLGRTTFTLCCCGLGCLGFGCFAEVEAQELLLAMLLLFLLG